MLKTEIYTTYSARFETSERETSITKCWSDEYWKICSSEPRIMTKCRNAGYLVIARVLDKEDRETVIQETYLAPKKAVSFRKILD